MRLGRPEAIFELPFQTSRGPTYDIAPDGTRFLMTFANNQSGRGSRIVVVKYLVISVLAFRPPGERVARPRGQAPGYGRLAEA